MHPQPLTLPQAVGGLAPGGSVEPLKLRIRSVRIQARCYGFLSVYHPIRAHVLLRRDSRFNFKCAILLCATLMGWHVLYSNCKTWFSLMPQGRDVMSPLPSAHHPLPFVDTTSPPPSRLIQAHGMKSPARRPPAWHPLISPTLCALIQSPPHQHRFPSHYKHRLLSQLPHVPKGPPSKPAPSHGGVNGSS